MEILYIIAAFSVVFLCLFCFIKGVKIGRALRDDKPLERVIEPPKHDPKPTDEQIAQEKQFDALFGYQPKFTERRDKA